MLQIDLLPVHVAVGGAEAERCSLDEEANESVEGDTQQPTVQRRVQKREREQSAYRRMGKTHTAIYLYMGKAKQRVESHRAFLVRGEGRGARGEG